MGKENGAVDKVPALQVQGSESNLQHQCNELDMITDTFNASIREAKMLDSRGTPVNHYNESVTCRSQCKTLSQKPGGVYRATLPEVGVSILQECRGMCT